MNLSTRLARIWRPILAVLAIVCISAGWTGCETGVGDLLITKSRKEKEIAALRAGFQSQMEALRLETESATKQVLAGKDAQMVKAAGSFAAQKLVFDAIVQPTRTDLLFRNYAVEGHAALGNVQPSVEDMRLIAERVAKERDEARTSLAALQSAHEQALNENRALAEATAKHVAELAALETKRLATEREFAAKLDAKQQELVETQARLIAAEKARADDRAALQALKTKASIGLGIVGLAAIAAAIYLPVFRGQCAGFGALCLLGAGAVWYIQPWMVGVTVAVLVFGLIGWMALKHRKEERLADGLVLGLQRLKDTSKDTWAKVAPMIQDSLGKYTKQGGKTVVVPDPAMEALVDAKLKEYEQLGSTPALDADPVRLPTL